MPRNARNRDYIKNIIQNQVSMFTRKVLKSLCLLKLHWVHTMVMLLFWKRPMWLIVIWMHKNTPFLRRPKTLQRLPFATRGNWARITSNHWREWTNPNCILPLPETEIVQAASHAIPRIVLNIRNRMYGFGPSFKYSCEKKKMLLWNWNVISVWSFCKKCPCRACVNMKSW